jgi:nucleolar protein 4
MFSFFSPFLLCVFSDADANTFVDQVNILKNEKNGVQTHSRGVAFVDFQEHEHALVALRVLNNNPGTLHS